MKKAVTALLVVIMLIVVQGNGIAQVPIQNSVPAFKTLEESETLEVSIDGKKMKTSALNNKNTWFINSKEIFELMGYSFTSNDNSYIFKLKNETIILENYKNFVIKNDLKLPTHNDILEMNNDLYITLDLAESLLTIKSEITDNKIVIKDISKDAYGWTENKVIAHALGSINGKPETCSLEAFEYNYQYGQRLFECDFIFTSDGHLVARHDWSSWLYSKFLQQEPEGNDEAPLSLEKIKSMPIAGEYTTLDFKDIAVLMSKYKDMYLVTDTKEYEDALVKKQFEMIVKIAKEVDPEILNRIIPQFYFEDMYYIVNDIYEFPSYIYTLYMVGNMSEEQVVNFATKNNINVITMHYDRANKEFVNTLREKGIKAYVHTLNNMQVIQTYIDNGVHGFYSDHITPDYFDLEAVVID